MKPGIHGVEVWRSPRTGVDGFGEKFLSRAMPVIEPRTLQPVRKVIPTEPFHSRQHLKCFVVLEAKVIEEN
jgi:hypothetical protein